MSDDKIETGPILVSDEIAVRVVTACFETRADADTARADLLAGGVAAAAIALVVENDEPPFGPEDTPAGSFWETLKDIFMPETDRAQFAEGVRRGGATLAVRTDSTDHDRVVEILDRDGAIDLDEHEERWRHAAQGHDDPLALARTPALSIAADDEDMGYTPPSDATAGFGASGADHFPIIDDTETAAPPVESPGALPPSVLDSAPPSEAAADRVPRRESHRGSGRVRSYVIAPARFGRDPLP